MEALGAVGTRGTRLGAALLLVVPVVLGFLVFTPGFSPDPDSGYHLGCAELYAEHGWIRQFPWLGFTVLGPRFPNVHLLQHLALVPVALLFDPARGLGAAMVLLSSVLALSLYLVLRRWSVPWAAAWAVLGSLGSTYLVVCHTSLRGGSLFSILLVWFVDAVWARSWKRTLLFAWLSVYAYVGAPFLLAIALVFTLVQRAWERRWDLRLLGATVLGLLAGMVVNPFWPAHWAHTGHELLSVFAAPVSPMLRGGEWLPIDSKVLFEIAGPALAAWFAVLVVQAGRAQRLSVGAAAGLVVAGGLFGATLLSGAKILYLFLLASGLFVPLVAAELGPWPRWAIALALVLGIANAGWNVRYRYHSRDRFPPAEDYRKLAAVLERESADGEVVVAPWDDFGGLFLFDRRNHYVAGLNTEFLERTDPQRYNAYVRLFAGQVEDPARVLHAQFGTRWIVVRREPRGPSDQALLKRLQGVDFDELDSGAPSFRLFRAR